MVVVSREEDLLVTKLTSALYIKVVKEALENVFHAFKIANTSYICERAQIWKPHLSMTPVMMDKVMPKDRSKPRDGLGKYGQGTQKPLKIPKNDENFGLEYKPIRVNKIRVTNEKREKKMACLES